MNHCLDGRTICWAIHLGMRESNESQMKGSDSEKQDSLITLLSESGYIPNYRTVVE